jgi:hypothetical protein
LGQAYHGGTTTNTTRAARTSRPARGTTSGPIDHRLRAIVRILARQAARETFETQVKAYSQTIQ